MTSKAVEISYLFPLSMIDKEALLSFQSELIEVVPLHDECWISQLSEVGYGLQTFVFSRVRLRE